MGQYINPGNRDYAEIIEQTYVDKTMLISLINESINTPYKLICLSLPRSFGKTYSARMLSAYYDSSCDSPSLFDDKKIAETEDYLKHLNKYNVIYLNVSEFKVENIRRALSAELDTLLDSPPLRDIDLEEKMLRVVEQTGRKFVFIIDEWDSVIRAAGSDTDPLMVQERDIHPQNHSCSLHDMNSPNQERAHNFN